MIAPYPFSAIVGQTALKDALAIAAVDPRIGGVLVFGDRGTGKSTAIRGLASLLPKIEMVEGCPYNCAPDAPAALCPRCATRDAASRRKVLSQVPVVDLPLGATEDRVVGALDLERALTRGEKAFEPGLLARAHRGFLYIDEVNLLEDHIVDLLLDVAASGENVVEREGLSVRHPARFVLVGSGNPEEGDLRPQLLDRFGLSLDIATPDDIKTRVEIVKRREAYDRDPDGFAKAWHKADHELQTAIKAARGRLNQIETPDAVIEKVAMLCQSLGTDGLRGELTIMRAARARAALDGVKKVSTEHLKAVASSALAHRLRRDPLDEASSRVRIERSLAEHGL
jgi:magnesium chelatase subunit I